ncbi:hypothetical protein [Burkholderia metallica]|uniref:hypothetical protein n=1 Tax=Burkholderia metallica TaxID=488729 RepID=UPI00158C88E4|nr:hypothetical protein [Burkholderia metallica]
MQDITGRFALPLAAPFSDVPPPYGRCRRTFEKSRGPGPRVFDLCPHGISREQAKACAEDFGSDNQAWRRQHPARSSLRRRLVVGLAFTASCCLATHVLESSVAHPSPDTVYRGAISVASIQQPAPRPVSAVGTVDTGSDSAVVLEQHDGLHRDPVSNAAVPKTVTKSHNPGRHPSARAVRTNERSKEKPAVPVESVAEGLDMTDAEFAHWRDATRDHPPRQEPVSEEGAWYFNSVDHRRLLPY